ncbi:CCA tRNA nucleotidyltransferase [Desulforhopalus sp. 52FAK]
MSDRELHTQSPGELLGENYSPRLLDALLRVAQKIDQPLYTVGGTVRDYLLGIASNDLDLSVGIDPYECADMLVKEFGTGTVVPLAQGAEAAVRVVCKGEQVDFSSFRGGVNTIEEDLHLRDFTVNAMAIDYASLYDGGKQVLIDPTGGEHDLLHGIVRNLPRSFVNDPVRLLRGYRLSAVFGFELSTETRKEVAEEAKRITSVAAERVCHELQYIFESNRTAVTLSQMAEDGLLVYLLPELYEADGVEQPEFHHLDVLGHSFLALKMMEIIIADPRKYYPEHGKLFDRYLANPAVVRGLKWAALMHDVGKPETRAVREDKDGRVTFYGHDEVGKTIFTKYAKKSKWSQVDSELVGGLIAMHMHPFHLCNVQRVEMLSAKAALKLSQRAGDNIAGLFLLAMADSLASEGEKKPEEMEAELVELFTVVQKIYEETIEPVVKGPKLVTGHDLIEKFGLTPGPEFGHIMAELELARVEGAVVDRGQALEWITQFLEQEAVDE